MKYKPNYDKRDTRYGLQYIAGGCGDPPLRYAICFLILVLLSMCSCSRTSIDVSAESAIVVDAQNEKVLFTKNINERFPPASTVKVMTAIVAIENMDLDSEIIPTAGIIDIEPTVAGLKQEVRYKLKDLLAAILIKSANDAAGVIAVGVAGSREKFIRLMNEKAKKIGMKNTYFASASGLPTGKKDAQYTTVHDLAKMMHYASRYKIILELMSKKAMNIYGSDKVRIFLGTHNLTLKRNDEAPWGKTGYTKEAKRTFVGVDPSFEPDIIFAVLRSSKLWDDIITLKDGGLELYEKSRRTFIGDLVIWVKEQRRRGEESVTVRFAH